mmetsp:Transcript_12981/g.19665  ORF Transcript_12981/g.19665 Transcript_12981/m.19665 type:complete len:315 (-) Transcript_12981:133-1077(-)
MPSSMVTKSAAVMTSKQQPQQPQQMKPLQLNSNGYATPRSGQSDPLKNTIHEQKQKQQQHHHQQQQQQQQQHQHQQNTATKLHNPRQPLQSSTTQPAPSSSFAYKTNVPQSAHGTFPPTTANTTPKGVGTGGLSRFQQQHSSSTQSNQHLSNQHQKQQQYSNVRNISSTASSRFVNSMQQQQSAPKPKPPFASQSITTSASTMSFMSQQRQSTSSTVPISAINAITPLATSANNAQPTERPLTARGMNASSNSTIVSNTQLSQSSQSSQSLKENQNSNGKRVLSCSDKPQPQNASKKPTTFTSTNNPYNNNGKR